MSYTESLSVEKVDESLLESVRNDLSDILSENIGDITITEEDLASVLPSEKALERNLEDLLLQGYTVNFASSVTLIKD